MGCSHYIGKLKTFYFFSQKIEGLTYLLISGSQAAASKNINSIETAVFPIDSTQIKLFFGCV